MKKSSNNQTAPASALSDYIAASRYSRHDSSLGRREVWFEAVARGESMHLSRFADVNIGDLPYLPCGLHDAIRSSFAAVKAKDVLPSMRSLQFGGEAVLSKHARIYNCSFSYCDRVEFFSEAFWLLLCGVGTGFSVQIPHVEKLPAFAPLGDEVTKHQIADTIEGWADSLDVLIRSHVAGRSVEFDFSLIRPAGVPLKTSGGKAPGPEPLKLALSQVRRILIGAAGRKLRPIEAYDICMFTAKAVLSGGIRRSACLALFSADDAEMMNAKTGDWFAENPQRSASNNSALLIRGKATREQFDALFQAQKEFGEPGFFWSDSPDYGCNPCVEIGLHPRLVVTPAAMTTLRRYGYTQPLYVGQVLTGWQMCNLCTMNGGRANSAEKFYRMCAHAALIGTVQASYTDFAYLGPVSRLITENEALLGVSICGVLDNPSTLLDAETLSRGAAIVREVNAAVARAIGINAAARTTCVKPEGTASLLLNAGSGIHPHHARRYFRRVQAAKLDPVFNHFAEANPDVIESSVYDNSGNTKVITFAVEGPKDGLYREDMTACGLLEIVAKVQQHWVQAGRANETYSPGLHHNVSNTVTVRAHEWTAVGDYIWENREMFTGVAMLSETGDKAYAQAPLEAVQDEADMERWMKIHRAFTAVDYAALMEARDNTSLKEVIACAGGACALV